MCLIIDVNIVHKVYPTPKAEFRPVYTAISNRKAKIVYGGELTHEYERIEWFRRLLLRLDQQGSTLQVPNAPVNAETETLRQSGICLSDDPHILALARIAGVRLLCSEDNLLSDDFRKQGDPILEETFTNAPRTGDSCENTVGRVIRRGGYPIFGTLRGCPRLGVGAWGFSPHFSERRLLQFVSYLQSVHPSQTAIRSSISSIPFLLLNL